MDQSEDDRELERKIKQASRIASTITDQTTIERLGSWVEQLTHSIKVRRARCGGSLSPILPEPLSR